MVSHRYCFLGFVLFLRFKNDDILSPDQIKGGMILHFKSNKQRSSRQVVPKLRCVSALSGGTIKDTEE